MTKSVELLPVTQEDRDAAQLAWDGGADKFNQWAHLSENEREHWCEAFARHRLTTSPDKQSTDIAPEPGCFCTGAGICAMHKAMGDSVVVPRVVAERALSRAQDVARQPVLDGPTGGFTQARDDVAALSRALAAAHDANAGEP